MKEITYKEVFRAGCVLTPESLCVRVCVCIKADYVWPVGLLYVSLFLCLSLSR